MMVFRKLYHRRTQKLFAPYLSPDQVRDLIPAPTMGEWQAFKLLAMPKRALIQMARESPDAVIELRAMLERALSEAATKIDNTQPPAAV
jgi:hypothetical protein